MRKYAGKKKKVCGNESANYQIERDGVAGLVLFGAWPWSHICHSLRLGSCPRTRASPHPDLQEI